MAICDVFLIVSEHTCDFIALGFTMCHRHITHDILFDTFHSIRWLLLLAYYAYCTY